MLGKPQIQALSGILIVFLFVLGAYFLVNKPHSELPSSNKPETVETPNVDVVVKNAAATPDLKAKLVATPVIPAASKSFANNSTQKESTATKKVSSDPVTAPGLI